MIAIAITAALVAAVNLDESDKQQHAIAGAAIYGLTFAALSLPHPETGRPVMSRRARRWTSLGMVVAAGALKEALDSRDPENHTADWKDAAATVAGGGFAMGITWTF